MMELLPALKVGKGIRFNSIADYPGLRNSGLLTLV
jgi:hypothetical protein